MEEARNNMKKKCNIKHLQNIQLKYYMYICINDLDIIYILSKQKCSYKSENAYLI